MGFAFLVGSRHVASLLFGESREGHVPGVERPGEVIKFVFVKKKRPHVAVLLRVFYDSGC